MVLLGATGLAGAEAFDKGPYLQNVTTSSVTIMWETDPPTAGRVELLGTERRFESEATEIHEVRVDKLEPGHRYRYAVTVGGDTVEGEFATAPVGDAPFSFVVFGDNRSNMSAHQRVVDRVAQEVPDFILGTGDMVDDGGRDNEWQYFFDIERELLVDNVLFPSVGNHDRQGRGRTADNFRKYFALPENSPDPERYYAFTYGNARFLILDSNSYSFSLTDQTAWIEQQLQAARLDPTIRHIFVTMHHPPYSISLHGGQRELRERWTPLYEKYRVAAVFSGHDHVYSRAEVDEVHYFVSGGGGAPLYPRDHRADELDENATKFFERVNHYLRVHVIGDFIEVAAIRDDGTLIETVSWGELPSAEPAIAAVGSGSDESQHEESSAVTATPSLTPTTPRRGFGVLGAVGAALTLLAAAVLVWQLRS